MTARFVRMLRSPERGRLVRGVSVAAAAALLAFLTPSSARAQGTVTGRVTDAETGEPVAEVFIELVTSGGRAVVTATSDAQGQFRIAGAPAGSYSLVFSRIGYETRRLDGVAVGTEPTTVGIVTLVSRAFRMNPIVVSASRVEEKALEAPASISIVDRREIEARPATTAVDHVRDLPGVDVVTTGLTQHNVVTRGFNNIFSGALFVLSDNRWASVPSLRFNAYNLIPSTNEDVDRIEFVLGPGSALYGPNVDKGVMHIITRSPLDHQETTVSVLGGERDVFQIAGRQAGRFSENAGYKISGLYFRGRDWHFLDSVEVSTRAIAQACLASFSAANPACQALAPAPGQTPDSGQLERIGERDFDNERFSGEARFDFRLADESSLVLSGGFSQLGSSIELTGIGAAQAQDWRYTYAQARLRHRGLFAQSYINFSNAGDTYLLRDGDLVVDNSFLYVAQVQHTSRLSDRQRFIYGVDLIQTVPRTDSTITGRNESDDNITEVGGYVQSESRLSPKLDFVAAARIDYHSVIDDVVFSPRAGFVIKPAEGHNFRITYNRAFSQPTSNNLFLDRGALENLGGLPFDVRVTGSKDGFQFARDPGGRPLMRSPFTPAPLGGPAQQLPLDATIFWPVVVQILLGQGVDLRPIPAPTAAQVGTVMRSLNATTRAFNTVDDVTDIEPIQSTITNTVEVGYKGLIEDRLLLGIDVYYSKIKDFVGPLLIETPSVFLDRASLTAYLSNFMPAAQAAQLAAGIAGIDGNPSVTGIPLATVTPINTVGDPYDIFLTYRNFGNVDVWGVDLGGSLLATDEISFSGTYSFLNKNLFRDLDGVTDLALNSPKNKVTLSAEYRNERVGLGVELRGRYVDAFPVNSGAYVGRVESYALMDANVNYALPFSRSTSLTLSTTNLFDNRHQQVVGAPEIGRLVFFRVRQSF